MTKRVPTVWDPQKNCLTDSAQLKPVRGATVLHNSEKIPYETYVGVDLCGHLTILKLFCYEYIAVEPESNSLFQMLATSRKAPIAYLLQLVELMHQLTMITVVCST